MYKKNENIELRKSELITKVMKPICHNTSMWQPQIYHKAFV